MKKISAKNSLKKTINNIFWLYKQFYSINKFDTILASFFPILMALFPIASSYIWAKLIDQLVKLTQLNINSFEDLIQKSDLIWYLVASMAVSLSSGLFYKLNSLTYRRFYDIHLDVFRMNLVYKISTLDVASVEDEKIFKLLIKGRDNLYKITTFINGFSTLFINLIQLIANSIIILSFSPIIYIIFFILALPESIIQRNYTKKKWDFYNSNAEQNVRIYWLENSLYGTYKRDEHIINRTVNFLFDLYKNLRLDYIRKEFSIEKWVHKKRLLFEVGYLIRSLISASFFVMKLLQKIITIGDLTFFWDRMNQFSDNLTRVSDEIITLFDINIEIDTLRDIYDLQPVVKSGNIPIKDDGSIKIEFRDVWFKYPKSKNFVLKNINLTINNLDEIAFVGDNGAGKTTLVKLLLRTYDPTKGEILLNGINIKKYILDNYLSLFGVLLQRFNTYGELDVKTNIAIGRPNDPIVLDSVIEASKKADAHEFIEKLDKKYDQMLAKYFEKGTELSGGQWQKLAFARLFYRDAPIIILDEATSSIDAEAEERIFTKLYETVNDKIVILISHRFATVRHAKRIFVIDNGQISEQGSHKKLLALDGKYAKMFNTQAKGYLNE